MGELSKTDCAGKSAPASVYVKDNFKYENPPAWSMGTGVRVAQDKPKYDFYENALFLDDPIEADNARRDRCKAPKIGT